MGCTAAFLVDLITHFMNGMEEALLLGEVRITLKRAKNGATIDNSVIRMFS